MSDAILPIRESIIWFSDPGVPVSTLYSIKIGAGKLYKPVTIEFQHCSLTSTGTSDNISDLMILRAADETKYFEPINDAVFDKESQCGKITVPKLNGNQEYDDFSWFIVALRRLFLPNTIHYKGHVYISKTILKMCFIITMAIEPCTMIS